MGDWSPNKEVREDIVLLRRGEHSYGPLPALCAHCERLEEYRYTATHMVILALQPLSKAHLTRLVKPLDNPYGGKGETFCMRKFRYKSIP